jgi:hypothetical protein
MLVTPVITQKLSEISFKSEETRSSKGVSYFHSTHPHPTTYLTMNTLAELAGRGYVFFSISLQFWLISITFICVPPKQQKGTTFRREEL